MCAAPVKRWRFDIFKPSLLGKSCDWHFSPPFSPMPMPLSPGPDWRGKKSKTLSCTHHEERFFGHAFNVANHIRGFSFHTAVRCSFKNLKANIRSCLRVIDIHLRLRIRWPHSGESYFIHPLPILIFMDTTWREIFQPCIHSMLPIILGS